MQILQADCDIRDYGKKCQNLEIAFDETNDKLQKASESLEEKEKTFKEVEGDVAALTRRLILNIEIMRLENVLLSIHFIFIFNQGSC